MLHSTAMPQQSDLVSTREAMEILGYRNPSSVARMVYEGKLQPAHQMGGKGGSYVFHRADIDRLVEERQTQAIDGCAAVSPTTAGDVWDVPPVESAIETSTATSS